MEYQVTQLFIYPIKSLSGIEVTHSQLDATGLEYDRRWMLIDANNRFISQREFPLLCLFKTALTQSGIHINYKNHSIEIPHTLSEGNKIDVTIWDDTVPAICAPYHINDWFSDKLQQPVRLVYMPTETKREVDPRYASQQEIVSFADGYPLLMIGETSLQLLQSKLPETISMNRFRPNIVFSGGEAHCEDNWKTFYINQLPFKGVKPCARCMITTIDPNTGNTSAEPLRTLATYRKQDQKVLFGQNILAPTKGSIAVGMNITF
jgi:uncharacterized protein YcbX